jgi:serine phosphatase RsbU (regulator of sigma subunit)
MAGQNAEDAAGAVVDVDPQVRELRDKVLADQHPEAPPGFEIDAAMAAGSRGGLDYFDCITKDGTTVMFLIGAGGNNTASVLASRMARDEMVRAIGAGANARKALTHTNRVLHKTLPRGVCAIATLLEVGEDAAVKLYQAGARVPVVLCAAGELEDLTAEGLALGLDSGPVFEKGLRSNKLELAAGMRLVVVNDAGNRNEELIESIREHSPKHTAPFMNMVLGELEDGAGAAGLREDVVLMTLKRG